jgi:hypothetical protein
MLVLVVSLSVESDWFDWSKAPLVRTTLAVTARVSEAWKKSRNGRVAVVQHWLAVDVWLVLVEAGPGLATWYFR